MRLNSQRYVVVVLLKVCFFAHHFQSMRSEYQSCLTFIAWGVLWLFISIIFFAAGILVGIAAFKETAAQQKQDSSVFLPVPGSGAMSLTAGGHGVGGLVFLTALVVGILGVNGQM